ncbi:GNAT family N-acetyltransferase [Nocardioides alcanivorans]|uniref:GNAT family N-acetyltransferase n=1 Tax=Nocardioides alcanivorans TaxID=2897352 RepID=UPI001F41C9E0|nr:GNAT family protein [Nocardioides alcanivorans]
MTDLLRPLTEEDLPLLTGDDVGFDYFGPRAPRLSVPAPDLNDQGGFAVVDVSGRLVGSVSWVWQRWGPNVQSRNPMIGIWLSAPARGRGLGTTAQRQLVDLFFRHTAVNRVEAHTDVENIAEQRALEKVGFTREGTTRGAQWRDGGYRDGHLYSILRNEWQTATA